MAYTYTPQELISTTPTKLSDGSLLVGSTVISPQKVGEKIVGRGNKGVGKGAGSNIFKANAIEEVYKRGRGKDGTYMSNGGLLGYMTGITEEDVENYATTLYTSKLKENYDRDLKSLGLKGVQWGDTDVSIRDRIEKAKRAKSLKETEPGRIKAETEAAQARIKAENIQIKAENERGRQFEAQQTRLDNQEKEDKRRFDLQQQQLFEQSKQNRLDRALERELSAQNNAMQMQLEYARLAQSDREKARDRKDQAIVTLMQGLGNLGMAFTV